MEVQYAAKHSFHLRPIPQEGFSSMMKCWLVYVKSQKLLEILLSMTISTIITMILSCDVDLEITKLYMTIIIYVLLLLKVVMKDNKVMTVNDFQDVMCGVVVYVKKDWKVIFGLHNHTFNYDEVTTWYPTLYLAAGCYLEIDYHSFGSNFGFVAYLTNAIIFVSN